MITWHRALSEGASGLFDCGGKKVFEIAEEQVRELHAIIGELAVANDFLHGISNRVPASEAGMIGPCSPELSLLRSSFYYRLKS